MSSNNIYANFNWNTPTNKFSDIKPQIEALSKSVNISFSKKEQYDIIHARDALFDSIIELLPQLDAMKRKREFDITNNDEIVKPHPFQNCNIKYIRRNKTVIISNIPCIYRDIGNTYWSKQLCIKLRYTHPNALTQYIQIIEEPVIEKDMMYPIIRLYMPLFCCDLNDDEFSESLQVDILCKISPAMTQEIIKTLLKEVKYKRFYYILRRGNNNRFYLTCNDKEYDVHVLLTESLKQTILVNFPGFAFNGDVLIEM